MKILLDTHILLWTLTNDSLLPQMAKELISDRSNDIYYSTISLWEVELKHIAHPNNLKVSAKQVAEYCQNAGLVQLQFQKESIYQLSNLSRPESEPPHKDPFDRILICQAITNDMKFLTHDSLIKGYTSDNTQVCHLNSPKSLC